MSLVSLLLLQHQDEVLVEAALHHHPVHGAGEIYVRRQKHDVLPDQGGDGLVGREEVIEDHVEIPALPGASGPRTGAGVGTERTLLLVEPLGGVMHLLQTARAHVLAREPDAVGHLLHRQVPHTSEGAPTAGTVLDLLLARGADDVPRVALVDDGREGVVETDRALEEHGEIGSGGAYHDSGVADDRSAGEGGRREEGVWGALRLLLLLLLCGGLC